MLFPFAIESVLPDIDSVWSSLAAMSVPRSTPVPRSILSIDPEIERFCLSFAVKIVPRLSVFPPLIEMSDHDAESV